MTLIKLTAERVTRDMSVLRDLINSRNEDWYTAFDIVPGLRDVTDDIQLTLESAMVKLQAKRIEIQAKELASEKK